METVTVDTAIKKGRLHLVWIPLSIMFGLLISIAIVLPFIEDGTIWEPICGLGGFFLAFSLPLLYYFLMLPRWRIWAFTNVGNVHELKQRAIAKGIYPKDNSVEWRFEIKSAKQKDALKKLELRFQQADVFEGEHLVPSQTTKRASWIFTISHILLFALVLFGLSYFDRYYLQIIIGYIVTAYVSARIFVRYVNKHNNKNRPPNSASVAAESPKA